MKFYIISQINKLFSTAAEHTPPITKIMLHVTISIALLSVSGILFLIAAILAKQLFGML